jgi:hypothetical protein
VFELRQVFVLASQAGMLPLGHSCSPGSLFYVLFLSPVSLVYYVFQTCSRKTEGGKK